MLNEAGGAVQELTSRASTPLLPGKSQHLFQAASARTPPLLAPAGPVTHATPDSIVPCQASNQYSIKTC